LSVGIANTRLASGVLFNQLVKYNQELPSSIPKLKAGQGLGLPGQSPRPVELF
jgi:hypothetical protein